MIIIARGGGGFEDLLPFSDEALCRAVFACRTPVVSAIGHEPDTPLVDYVADVRASTPTDAAKRVVPDLAEEVRLIRRPGTASNARCATWSTASSTGSTAIRSRPVLARPKVMIDQRARRPDRAAPRAGRCRTTGCRRRRRPGAHARPAARPLPRRHPRPGLRDRPAADGHVVRTTSEVGEGDALRVRLADGELAATVDG